MIGLMDFRENIIDPVLSRQLIGLRPDVDVKPPDRGGVCLFSGNMTAKCREDARRRSGNRKHLVDKKNDRRGFLLPFEIQWGRRERIKMPLKFFAPKKRLNTIKIKGFGENLAPNRRDGA